MGIENLGVASHLETEGGTIRLDNGRLIPGPVLGGEQTWIFVPYQKEEKELAGWIRVSTILGGYREAWQRAVQECRQLEQSLGLPDEAHISLYRWLEEWGKLLDSLERIMAQSFWREGEDGVS